MERQGMRKNVAVLLVIVLTLTAFAGFGSNENLVGADERQETIWKLNDHLDKTEFATEVAGPGWGPWAGTSVYSNTAGSPYGGSGYYYTFSLAGLWVKTTPTLQAAGTYDLYLYVPHNAGVEDGAVTVREEGQDPKVFTVNTKAEEGTWVLAGNHTYTATEPELTFELGPNGGDFRVDAIKFVPADAVPSPGPSSEPPKVYFDQSFDSESTGIYDMSQTDNEQMWRLAEPDVTGEIIENPSAVSKSLKITAANTKERGIFAPDFSNTAKGEKVAIDTRFQLGSGYTSRFLYYNQAGTLMLNFDFVRETENEPYTFWYYSGSPKAVISEHTFDQDTWYRMVVTLNTNKICYNVYLFDENDRLIEKHERQTAYKSTAVDSSSCNVSRLYLLMNNSLKDATTELILDYSRVFSGDAFVLPEDAVFPTEGPSAEPSKSPSPAPSMTPDPEGAYIWTVAQHEDRTAFSTEVAPDYSSSRGRVYRSVTGTPYVSGLSYYVFSASSANPNWIRTSPVLPEAGAYRMYLYVPYEAGTNEAEVSVIENGKITRTIYDVSTNQPTGSWVDLGAHQFKTAEPEIKFSFAASTSTGDFRVDSIKFVKVSDSEVEKPSFRYIFDDDNKDVFSIDYGILDDNSDYGLSSYGGPAHHYCNTAGVYGIYSLQTAPKGTYDVYVYIPNVHTGNTTNMSVIVNSSDGKSYEQILDIHDAAGNGVNADGSIRGNMWVKIGGEFFFDPDHPGEVRIGKRADNLDGRHFRADKVKLMSKSELGPEPSFVPNVSPSPQNYTKDVYISSLEEFSLYPEPIINGNSSSASGGWVRSAAAIEDVQTIYTRAKDAWAKFAPVLDKGHLGTYKVYYYNIYKADTAPIDFEVKASGRVFTPQVRLQTGLTRPMWQEIGTFEFNGNGDEYVLLKSQGKEYARATAIRFELIENKGTALAVENVKLSGSFIAGKDVRLSYDYIDYDGNKENGSTYQLYYADSKTPSSWTKSILGTCSAENPVNIPIPQEAAGKYIKVGVTPKRGDTAGQESFSQVIGPISAEQIAPQISQIKITGEPVAGTILKGSYTYSDENFDEENGSTYQWYYAESADASEWTAAPNGAGVSASGTPIEYIVPAILTGKYLKLGVTPKNSSSALNTGAEGYSEPIGTITANEVKGKITSVQYGGQIVTAANQEGFAVGGKIEIDSYIFVNEAGVMEDAENAQYQWYIGTSSTGEFDPIEGADEAYYTPAETDAAKYIRVGIKPASANGTVGEEYFAQPMLVRWNLKFFDEFDYTAANGYDPKLLEKWNSDMVGFCSFGVTEPLNSYRVPENVEVKDGKLLIHNRKETLPQYEEPHTWTTANICTKEQFNYGFYESSFKFAPSAGLNQSFWTMANGPIERHTELDFCEGHYPREIATNIMRYEDRGTSDSLTSNSIKHKNVYPAPQTLADDFNKVSGLFKPNNPNYAWNAEENADTYQVFLNDKQIRSTTSLPYVPNPGNIYLSCAILGTPFSGGALSRNPDGSYTADGSAIEYDYVRFFEPLEGTAKAELEGTITDAENLLANAAIGNGFGEYSQVAADSLRAAINVSKNIVSNADEITLREQLSNLKGEMNRLTNSINNIGEAKENGSYDLGEFVKRIDITIPANVKNVSFTFPKTAKNEIKIKKYLTLPTGGTASVTLTIPMNTQIEGRWKMPQISGFTSDSKNIEYAVDMGGLTFGNDLAKVELTPVRSSYIGLNQAGVLQQITTTINQNNIIAAREAIGELNEVVYCDSNAAFVYTKGLSEYIIFHEIQDETPTPTPDNQQGGNSGSQGGNNNWTPGIIVPPGGNNTNKVKFTDIAGHWAEKEIRELAKDGVINGRSESEYAPEDTVSRAEFAALIRRAIGLNLSAYQGGFGDVTADSWYAREVQAIVESGIMNGDSEGHFRPEAPISREEMAKVLVNAYCMKNRTNDIPDIELSYTDNSEIAPWAAGYVQKAAALKLIFGMDDGSFMPKGNMTRAQGAAVIYRLVH